jgi:prophage antirepressor-like protein
MVDDEDKKSLRRSDTPQFFEGVAPQVQFLTVVNESGLYAMIFQSNKPEAQHFRRWVTHEVLPTIRKTKGAYIAPGSQAELDLTNPDTALEKLIEISQVAQAARAAQRSLDSSK